MPRCTKHHFYPLHTKHVSTEIQTTCIMLVHVLVVLRHLTFGTIPCDNLSHVLEHYLCFKSLSNFFDLCVDALYVRCHPFGPFSIYVSTPYDVGILQRRSTKLTICSSPKPSNVPSNAIFGHCLVSDNIIVCVYIISLVQFTTRINGRDNTLYNPKCLPFISRVRTYTVQDTSCENMQDNSSVE